MKILVVQIALTLGLGIPPSWTKEKRVKVLLLFYGRHHKPIAGCITLKRG